LDETKLVVALIVLNIPIYVLIWAGLFGGWDTFKEALYYLWSPDLIDWFRGEGLENQWSKLKLFWFLAICALLVGSEYFNLLKHAPNLARRLAGFP
jgi:hypothetical protein